MGAGPPGLRLAFGRQVRRPLAATQSVAAIYRSFMEGTLSEAAMADWWNTVGVFDARGGVPGVGAGRVPSPARGGPGEAILFHCAGGKDRTGTVAALILRALGAPPDAILADFMATNDSLATPERLEELAAHMNRGRDKTISQQALFAISGVKAEWLDVLLRPAWPPASDRWRRT